MAKIRGIKPDFWTDEDVMELSGWARLLFIGMWNYACDNGHMQDKSKQIKMRILPSDDVNVAELLRELEAKGMLNRADGWITIPTLTRHQKVDRRYFTTCAHEGCESPKEAVSQRESRRAPTVHTSGTRGVHASALGDGDGDGDGDLKGNAQPSAGTREITEQFDTFWKAYPRREGRGRALTAYRSALKKTDAETILHGVEEYAAWTKREGTQRKYMAHPTTWLNGERWTDERDGSEAEDPRVTTPADLELPPDGLSPDEYREWAAARRTA